MKKKDKKRQIKRAKQRQIEQENKQDTDKEEENEENKASEEEEEKQHWGSRLHGVILEIAGKFTSKLQRDQIVWVIDEDVDEDGEPGPPAVFKGITQRTQAKWMKDGDTVWEIELYNLESYRTKYPIWAVLIS
jgi:hypothetical protein